jgi:hypothetical protein
MSRPSNSSGSFEYSNEDLVSRQSQGQAQSSSFLFQQMLRSAQAQRNQGSASASSQPGSQASAAAASISRPLSNNDSDNENNARFNPRGPNVNSDRNLFAPDVSMRNSGVRGPSIRNSPENRGPWQQVSGNPATFRRDNNPAGPPLHQMLSLEQIAELIGARQGFQLPSQPVSSRSVGPLENPAVVRNLTNFLQKHRHHNISRIYKPCPDPEMVPEGRKVYSRTVLPNGQEVLASSVIMAPASIPSQPSQFQDVPLGLDPSALRQMTRCKFTNSMTKECCSICHSEFEVGDDILITRCPHRIHEDCGTEWFSRSFKCPQCSSDVGPSVNQRGVNGASSSAPGWFESMLNVNPPRPYDANFDGDSIESNSDESEEEEGEILLP